MQHGDGGEAPAGDEDERRLALAAQAALQLMLRKGVVAGQRRG